MNTKKEPLSFPEWFNENWQSIQSYICDFYGDIPCKYRSCEDGACEYGFCRFEKAEEEAVYRYSLYLEENNVDNRYEVEWNPQINKYCQFGKVVDFEV